MGRRGCWRDGEASADSLGERGQARGRRGRLRRPGGRAARLAATPRAAAPGVGHRVRPGDNSAGALLRRAGRSRRRSAKPVRSPPPGPGPARSPFSPRAQPATAPVTPSPVERQRCPALERPHGVGRGSCPHRGGGAAASPGGSAEASPTAPGPRAASTRPRRAAEPPVRVRVRELRSLRSRVAPRGRASRDQAAVIKPSPGRPAWPGCRRAARRSRPRGRARGRSPAGGSPGAPAPRRPWLGPGRWCRPVPECRTG